MIYNAVVEMVNLNRDFYTFSVSDTYDLVRLYVVMKMDLTHNFRTRHDIEWADFLYVAFDIADGFRVVAIRAIGEFINTRIEPDSPLFSSISEGVEKNSRGGVYTLVTDYNGQPISISITPAFRQMKELLEESLEFYTELLANDLPLNDRDNKEMLYYEDRYIQLLKLLPYNWKKLPYFRDAEMAAKTQLTFFNRDDPLTYKSLGLQIDEIGKMTGYSSMLPLDRKIIADLLNVEFLSFAKMVTGESMENGWAEFAHGGDFVICPKILEYYTFIYGLVTRQFVKQVQFSVPMMEPGYLTNQVNSIGYRNALSSFFVTMDDICRHWEQGYRWIFPKE